MVWAPDPGAIGLQVERLDTPCLVLDLDAVERNLDAMAQAMRGRVGLRPHAKTHKVPNVARMQLERGALGLCCAKLGEAKVLAAGGIPNLLITTEVVGEAKIRRLLALARQADVMTVVDDERSAHRLSDAAMGAGLRLRTLVDINVGQNRTGVEPGEPALSLARTVDSLPGLELHGVQGYEGHLQHIVDPEQRRTASVSAMDLLAGTVELLLGAGLPIEIVSTAGTGTAAFAAERGAVTELQPGSYVVMDSTYSGVGGLSFENALTVLTTVISVKPGVAIVDSGHKSLSSDLGPPRPIGLAAEFDFQGDEHGKLTFPLGRSIDVGDVVRLIPSHCDTTINLHDLYYVERAGVVIAVWPIAARGRVQ
jgi:D-serine deaminase-like pyridoxal phosphate-dependent protein